jgi:uncharacterized protein YndB with AHSA1/START domain
MANDFRGTAVIDRPPDEVFDFLADGTNDPKFSPRVVEIEQVTDGPVRAGTVFRSTVKDAGMKTQREFEITEFERPSRIRWAERSKNLVTAKAGGYDLEPAEGGTRLTVFNELEGHGFGKVIAPLALRAARKDADPFAARIKQAVEST